MKALVPMLTSHFEWLVIGFLGLFAFWRFSIRKTLEQQAKHSLKKAVEAKMDEPLTLHPEIDPEKCLGCGACTKVCPEGDILKLVNHKAVLVSPTKCVGHGECERACPFDAITLVFGTKTRGMDIPRLSTNYETNVPGLYIAGELGGMGLIRNAVKQGVMAATHALANLPSTTEKVDADILIVGAGPAGIAAGISAIEKGKSYILIEQNTVGGTVANFPRQKVVMSYPLEFPMIGKMKFSSHKVSKEDLLEAWRRAIQETGLVIQEQEKFESLKKQGLIFEVKTSRKSYRVKKVVLAMGVRGSPRRLGLPNEDMAKVTYNLLDPEQYQKKYIAVVGGGNAAVEAAQYLGKRRYGNKVTLLVRGDDFDRCNEENKTIIKGMAKKGLVRIWFNSTVMQIHQDHLIVSKAGEEVRLNNEYLFIFAGADMPHKFLMSLGIGIDKKFGEALTKTA